MKFYYKLFYCFLLLFTISFLIKTKSYAQVSFNYDTFGTYNNRPIVIHNSYDFDSDDIKAVCYEYFVDGSIRSFSIQLSYKLGEIPNFDINLNSPIHYVYNTEIRYIDNNELAYPNSSSNGYLQSSDLRICYRSPYNGLKYFDFITVDRVSNPNNFDDILNSVSGIPIYDTDMMCFEYLFTGEPSLPDFSDYEYSDAYLIDIKGHPYYAGLDLGTVWFDKFAYYYLGYTSSPANKVLIRFIGSIGSTFVIHSVNSPLYDFKEKRFLYNVISPDSNFYVLATPYNDIEKTYGSTCIIEYPIDGSVIGKIIRSFGGSDNNYYSAKYVGHNYDLDLDYIARSSTFYNYDNPNSYNYNFLNNSTRYNNSYNYYPVFNDYSDLDETDIDIIIIDNDDDDDINDIDKDIDVDFDFNIDIGDISSNDIQKVVDDSQNLFGLFGNLLSVIATMFALTFPFLMFDIPGALLIIGGLLAGGALVGLAIKFINFIRGK